MAANQNRSPTIRMGYGGCHFGLDTTFGLNAAATWLGLQFVPSSTKTVSKVTLTLDSKTGTPTAAGCTADIYSDAVGWPNASLEGPVAADSVPAAGARMQWTFAGTTAVTGGTAYWIVLKNSTATPASNLPTYRYQANNGAQTPMPFEMCGIGGGSVVYGWNKLSTTNSGTSWGTVAFGVTGLRIEYTDGTWEGMPIATCTRPSSGGTADRAFGKSEVGNSFNIPAGVTFNTMRIRFPVIKVSTPGALRLSLYQGVTLLARTNSIPANNIVTATGDWYSATLTTVQPIISTNQPFRVTFGDATAADTNTVGYNAQIYTWDSDANSLTLKPMNGTLKKTITADNTATPVVFTDTNTDIIPFEIALDTTGELTSAGGGGGILVPAGMDGGFAA